MTGKGPSSMDCQECGMLCEPPGMFHPWLHCWLRKRGVLNPAKFLSDNGFIPDPVKFPSQKGSREASDG